MALNEEQRDDESSSSERVNFSQKVNDFRLDPPKSLGILELLEKLSVSPEGHAHLQLIASVLKVFQVCNLFVFFQKCLNFSPSAEVERYAETEWRKTTNQWRRRRINGDDWAGKSWGNEEKETENRRIEEAESDGTDGAAAETVHFGQSVLNSTIAILQGCGEVSGY